MPAARALARAALLLALFTSSISGARVAVEAGAHTPRNGTALGVILGGPSGTDTDSCGTTSGNFPTISAYTGLQLGCTGAFKSQTVSFSAWLPPSRWRFCSYLTLRTSQPPQQPSLRAQRREAITCAFALTRGASAAALLLKWGLIASAIT